MREIAGLMSIEEIYWKQRSRVLWLSDGDRNCKLFHQRASGRKHKNTIRRLRDDAGIEHVGDEELEQVAISYFQTIFASSQPPLISEAIHEFGSWVTDNMNVILLAIYREKEVKLALSQMHPIKAPGPDGMCPMFFQIYLHILGHSVSQMVLRILRGILFRVTQIRSSLLLFLKRVMPSTLLIFVPSICVMWCISWFLKFMLIV